MGRKDARCSCCNVQGRHDQLKDLVVIPGNHTDISTQQHALHSSRQTGKVQLHRKEGADWQALVAYSTPDAQQPTEVNQRTDLAIIAFTVGVPTKWVQEVLSASKFYGQGIQKYHTCSRERLSQLLFVPHLHQRQLLVLDGAARIRLDNYAKIPSPQRTSTATDSSNL